MKKFELGEVVKEKIDACNKVATAARITLVEAAIVQHAKNTKTPKEVLAVQVQGDLNLFGSDVTLDDLLGLIRTKANQITSE